MDPQELRSKLHGVIGFPVTPFNADHSLDLPGLRRNVEFLLKHPIAALVAAGGTGEFYSLTPNEHRSVVETTVSAAAGKAPVIAGVGIGATLGAEMARSAEAAGAHGILMLPPYYVNAHEDGLLEYYSGIAAATTLGCLIYTRDWVVLSSAMVERLAAKIPNLVALKDGQGDIRALQRIMARSGDRLVWIGGIGDDLVAGYYALGIRCYTSSIANIAPRLSMQLHERASAIDAASLTRLMSNYVIPLYNIRARKRGYEVSVMKAAMHVLGMAAGPVRPPLPSIRAEEENEVRSLMDRYKPVLSPY
ncbi:MAG TPA: 5-dehydro-4-deoxyglucarate dehydratase [Bryobacterales bacterium]|nr:5-dehydro-4-deoxyglucarate dehydratase [Bryobacterales bacterium]